MKTTTLLLLFVVALFAASSGSLPPLEYGAGGTLAIPDYSRWVFIGSGVSSPAQPSEAPTFSNMFVAPAAWEGYMKSGLWPDGTMILAEKRGGASMLPVTKNGGWSQTGPVTGMEVEVKDAAKGGWKFYRVAAGEKTARLLEDQQACTGCHAAKSAVDNTFVQFYPSLVDAAKHNKTWRE